MPPDRYAVIGHPVRHSLSPRIHGRFAEQTGEAMIYEHLEAPIDGFADTAAAFFADGGRGLNVTVPFKAEAFAWCDTANPSARRAGVANTLSLQANGWIAADNTDGIGLVRDLTVNLELALDGASILLIGAGGAARGVLGPLLDARPAVVTVANRTPGRAQALARDFAADGNVQACGLDEVSDEGPERGFDLIVNASAASLGGALPDLPDHLVATHGVVYDMMYGDAAEPFLAWGRDAGASLVADGLGMLVEQAAEAFALWRGKQPETAPVLAALRDQSRA